jgi:hypothetical protein
VSLGRPVDLDVFTRSASHLRRLWEALGLKREPRDVTMINGKAEVPFSPLSARWAAEDVAAEDAKGGGQ